MILLVAIIAVVLFSLILYMAILEEYEICKRKREIITDYCLFCESEHPFPSNTSSSFQGYKGCEKLSDSYVDDFLRGKPPR